MFSDINNAIACSCCDCTATDGKKIMIRKQ